MIINNISKLAYELCNIESISGNELLVMQFMYKKLQELGFLVDTISVDDNRFNLFAYKSKREKYNTIFCTHLDTVSPHITPLLKEEILTGRGSCDAKGIAASMVYATKEQVCDDTALLFTVGEEENSDGAKVCNKVLKNRARYIVIGEPTELKAASAQKGSLVFDLIAHGQESHSSMPHLGDSAVHNLCKAITMLFEHSWPINDLYGETLINFGEIKGGSMRNVLAANARALGIARLSIDSDQMLYILKEKLNKIDLVVHSKSDPFSYYVPSGFETFVAGFGSDAPYAKDIAKPILIGPGSLSVAHTPEEKILTKHMLDGFNAYQKIAEQIRNSYE